MTNHAKKKFALLAAVALLSGTALTTQAFASSQMNDAAAAGTMYTEASAGQAGAQEKGAFDFVKATTDRGLKFLADPNSTKAQKTAEFRKLLDQSFDLDTIGRFALGRYWNTATDAQKSEYLKLFRKMVVDVYTQRFDDYKGQDLQVKSFRSIGNQDTLVSSFMVPTDGSEQVPIDWRVRSKNGGYKIVDVLVAGVSMSVTQRSDFASVIQRGGGNVDALIAELKKGPKAQ